MRPIARLRGLDAVHFAAVSCGLFAAAPSAVRAAWQMCVGALIGIPALLGCYVFVLPAAHDFSMLCLALTPFLALGGGVGSPVGQVSAEPSVSTYVDDVYTPAAGASLANFSSLDST
jgi:hypothetical protein